MSLHHQPELENMRSAYGFSSHSRHSDSESSAAGDPGHSGSVRSYATQPTDYASGFVKRSEEMGRSTFDSRTRNEDRNVWLDKPEVASPCASTTSTVLSQEEQECPDEEMPDYDVPEYRVTQPSATQVVAATPSDFSQLFPSRRRMAVRLDDSTLDGNMNLRVDTQVSVGGRKCDMTLFHLRMHDLKNREFSLRRYCRDSGREVCHSERKQAKPKVERRPNIQRSLSNALSSMRPRSEPRTPTLASLKRHDSGYESLHSGDTDNVEHSQGTGSGIQAQAQASKDIIKLEFSNYAQVFVKRTGVKPSKRYEFEYWGIHYAWRRIVSKDGPYKEISYQLTRASHEKALGHITPLLLSPEQYHEELNKGGWIPPCSMWLADHSLIHGQKDAVDVVVAAGLIALVDDAIRTCFHSKTSRQMLVPLNRKQMSVDYIGPKRLINELFRRDSGSSQHSRPSTSSGRASAHPHGVTASHTLPGP